MLLETKIFSLREKKNQVWNKENPETLSLSWRFQYKVQLSLKPRRLSSNNKPVAMSILRAHIRSLPVWSRKYSGPSVPKGSTSNQSLKILGEKIQKVPKKQSLKLPGTWLLPSIYSVLGFINNLGFLGVSVYKNPSTNEAGSIPGWERCPGEGNGNPLQYSCLENPMDRGAWQATVRGPVNLVTKTTTRDDLKNIGGGTSLVVQWVIF